MTTGVHAIGELLDELRADQQLPLVVLVALHQTLLLLLTGRGSSPSGRGHEHFLYVIDLKGEKGISNVLIKGGGDILKIPKDTLMNHLKRPTVIRSEFNRFTHRLVVLLLEHLCGSVVGHLDLIDTLLPEHVVLGQSLFSVTSHVLRTVGTRPGTVRVDYLGYRASAINS